MSSSGYDRLYHQFKDIKEEEYLIQIYRLGVFLPTSYQIKYSDANPVQLTYGGGDKNSWDHTFIQGRELVFKFYVPRADIAVIDDLFESQYKEWYVEFSKGGVTLFVGYLKPENMYKRFEINPPYIEVELSATDGLAELKDIDFTLPGVNPIKDEVTLLEAIKNALTPVNIFLPFKIQVNTFPSEFTGYTLTTCSISESYCNAKRFYNITVEEDEEIIEPIKCWDVIEYCLKTFNCKLFQHKGYYTIVNHLELVKNSNSLTHIYDWNNIIAPTSSTLETDIFKDISNELYTPYVEQQKIHPLRSITSTIINTNAGESVGIDFTDWENVWEFSNDAEMHWASRIEQADGSLRCLIEDTDQPWMRLKTAIHIVPEDGKTTYLRFKGEFYCWFWNKWDGNIFKSDGKLSQTDIKIRVQKDNFWSPYLSLGTPIYSPDVNGVQVPKYITFDTKNHINLLITKEGDYNVEFFVDSLRGSQQFDALGIQLRNFEITIWDGAGNEYNPTNVNSKPTYYQVNIENNGFEDLEQELQLFDGVSTADSAALMMRKGGILYLTQYWDRRGGVDERKIIDINSIYILNNRMKYKNFLRCTIIDRTFQIDFEHILIIQSKYYTFSSYTRNFRTGDIEAELIELIHDSRSYPAITEATKTATIIEPLTPRTDEAEQLNIAVLKSAPITPWEVGDVIRAVQGDSEGDVEYFLAQADTLEHATAIGVITEIIDIDIFKYISNGYLPKEIFPCEVGQYYYLSPIDAGKMVTEPTYKEYEIEQAIGFGTEKGFYVEIDARNLNFKEIVETSQIPGGIPIYMHWENSDIQVDDSYTESDPSSGDSSGYEFYPSDYDKALLETPGDIDCVYGAEIRKSYGEIVIKKFITDPGVPNTILIPAGGWFFETYMKPSIQNVLSYTVHVYKRNLAGIETELFSFEQQLRDPNYLRRYDYTYACDTEIVLEVTDRLVFEYCAKSSISPIEKVELWVEGDTRTNVKIPIFAELLITMLEDNYVDSATFDEETRDLTLTRTGTLPDLVVNIPVGTTVEINSEGDIVLNPGKSNEETYTPPCTCDPLDLINGSTTNVKYGYLYNWWAATDARNIAPAGWHVPTDAEFITLRTYLGGVNIAGGKLKETGYTYWKSPNTGATNEVEFNARGSGYRNSSGFNNSLGTQCNFWIYDLSGAYILGNGNAQLSLSGYSSYWGNTIRLIKDGTTDTGTMTGNDGKVYPTVTIGTQVWMAANLMETKYRDGSPISGPTFTNAEWAALTTEAYCIYGDDPTNAGDEDEVILQHNLLGGLQGGSATERHHHTKAEIDTHVYEAPIDGDAYVRKDGDWEILPATGLATVETADSVVGSGSASDPVTLDGDEETPGNSKYYGTDGAGVKGYHDLPEPGGAVTTDGSVVGTGDASDPVTLDGDEDIPGNSKYYGTDSGGTKGFYDLPGGGTFTIVNESSGSFTASATHKGNYTRVNYASGVNVTMPADTFSPGDVFCFEHTGNGAVTIVADSGVTCNGYDGLTSYGQYAVLTVVCVASNVFTVIAGTGF